MPKKPPRNAFYFYMVNFKEEQRMKGIHYENMAEVAEAAGPLWRDAPPSIRTKFETMAKREKEKHNLPTKKFTSTGVSFAEIEQQEREQKEAEEAERKDIKNFVAINTISGRAPSIDIFLMDVNAFCKVGSEYLIGECTILRFNLQDGIMNIYHEMINPGSIPMGYAYEAKLGSQEFCIPLPDETIPRSNYMHILATTIDYLKQNKRNANTLPPIFTMPDKVAPVQDFIVQMCRRAEEDDSLFRVYKLDTLFFTLINAIKSRPDEGFPKESLALVQLKKDMFKYTPGIGCEHHNTEDKTVECTTSRVKRWAFTIMDSCCPVVGVDMKPGKHLPYDYDMDSILMYQEQKKGKMGATVADLSDQASNISLVSDTSTVMYDTASSLNSSAETSKNKRVHVPLRMPKTNFSKVFSAAPELSESDFPSLPLAGRGRGMGSSRSLASSVGKSSK
ncbi:unnamed protein product [Colias eurytheme]|nr:unnamed protein product [Colias eurytheme]